MVLLRSMYGQDDEPPGLPPTVPFDSGAPPGIPTPGGPPSEFPTGYEKPIFVPDEGGGGGQGGGGGMGGMGGGLRPNFRFGDVPEFVPPEFHQPTMEEAMQEPGYQFRLRGGSDALERSAAARGALRTGGTLKDIMEYGQNFATQEYGNVFNRALSAYDREYRGAYDAYAPRLAEWQFLSGAELQAAMAQFNAQHQGGGGGGGQLPPPPMPPMAPPDAPPRNVWWKTGNPPVF